MIGQFKFKGIHSSQYDVYFRSVSRPLLPPLRSKLTVIDGVSGSYDFNDNDYDNVQINIRIAYISVNMTDREQKARLIAAWLNSEGWEKLIFGDELDKYYLAKIYGQIDLDVFMSSGEANITFTCQPFVYAVDESIYTFNTTVAMNYYFNNTGTRLINYKSPQGSKFLIKVTGSWSALNLSMNGSTLSYNEAASGELIIDNVEMEAVLDSVNKFCALDGDIDTFLSVVPGENILAVGGTELNIVVTVEFIPMWL